MPADTLLEQQGLIVALAFQNVTQFYIQGTADGQCGAQEQFTVLQTRKRVLSQHGDHFLLPDLGLNAFLGTGAVDHRRDLCGNVLEGLYQQLVRFTGEIREKLQDRDHSIFQQDRDRETGTDPIILCSTSTLESRFAGKVGDPQWLFARGSAAGQSRFVGVTDLFGHLFEPGEPLLVLQVPDAACY